MRNRARPDGGQIPLGVFADLTGTDTGPDFIEIVERVITNRLVVGLKLADDGPESGSNGG